MEYCQNANTMDLMFSSYNLLCLIEYNRKDTNDHQQIIVSGYFAAKTLMVKAYERPTKIFILYKQLGKFASPKGDKIKLQQTYSVPVWEIKNDTSLHCTSFKKGSLNRLFK